MPVTKRAGSIAPIASKTKHFDVPTRRGGRASEGGAGMPTRKRWRKAGVVRWSGGASLTGEQTAILCARLAPALIHGRTEISRSGPDLIRACRRDWIAGSGRQ